MNQTQKFNVGLHFGMWFLAWPLLVLSGLIMIIDVSTGYLGILASGYVDFAGEYAWLVAGIVALNIPLFNLVGNYMVKMLWADSGQVKLFDAMRTSPNMRNILSVLAVTYMANTITQIWAIANGDYSFWWILGSFFVSIAVFTFLAEIAFTIAIGLIVANYEYVKPLFTSQATSPIAQTPPNIPTFPSGNSQQNNRPNNQQNQTRGQ